jgi:hypothetical protein
MHTNRTAGDYKGVIIERTFAVGTHIPRKPSYTDPGESESNLMLGRIGLDTVECYVLMDSALYHNDEDMELHIRSLGCGFKSSQF